MGAMIEFARPDGQRTRGYLAESGRDRPGILVVQEWWGLNDQIMGVADRLARAGYNALAPDLYRGKVTSKDDEANHLMSGLDFADAIHQDVRGAMLHLRRDGGKVAITGFCMGGAVAIAAAVHLGELASAIPFYGVPPKDFADPAKIRIPLQGHFSTKDDWITPQVLAEFEAALRTTGVRQEIHRYDAEHGFFNERLADRYDANAANLAWDRMSGFLKQAIG